MYVPAAAVEICTCVPRMTSEMQQCEAIHSICAQGISGHQRSKLNSEQLRRQQSPRLSTQLQTVLRGGLCGGLAGSHGRMCQPQNPRIWMRKHPCKCRFLKGISRPRAPGWGALNCSWMRTVYRYKEDELLEVAGWDAVVYLRILRFGAIP